MRFKPDPPQTPHHQSLPNLPKPQTLGEALYWVSTLRYLFLLLLTSLGPSCPGVRRKPSGADLLQLEHSKLAPT